MPDEKDLNFELDMERQKNDDYWKMIMRLRGGLQEIYAKRGEDELIAAICNPLIDMSSSY
jgi:hypothetical protein